MYKIGDKSNAICFQCGLVSITFNLKDVPIRNSEKVVKDLLVGVCDSCEQVVSIPAQSTPKIKQVIES